MEYTTWWPEYILDHRHLPPYVLNLAALVKTYDTYTWVQAITVLVIMWLIYYYLVLPMNYVRVRYCAGCRNNDRDHFLSKLIRGVAEK